MSHDRLKAIASVMIAVVTVFGAFAACRGSIASNDAGSADFEGLVSAIRAQETEINNHIIVYEHYRAFTDYKRFNELGNLVALEPASNVLGQLQREAWGVAQGLRFSFFPPRYVNPDGTYNIQRELDEQWAYAAQQGDIQPETHFEEADAARTKTSALAITLIIFAIAFWFFTIAQAIQNVIKYFAFAGGFFATFLGLAMFVLVEIVL
jgi:hypothetical protein